ncbi:unnamed protein product [Ectocarpus sp. CCAP 1310/34]|nr:unnamed protein product [Ectocarpus sp. CCAP 1310/34]
MLRSQFHQYAVWCRLLQPVVTQKSPPLPSLLRYFVVVVVFTLKEFSTLFPLCTHELALSTRPGAEAREKLNVQEKLAYAGIRTPDLTSRRFRSYQLDHRGDLYI